MKPTVIALLAALLAIALLSGPAAAAPMVVRTGIPCAWSQFEDARSMEVGGSVYTGCIGAGGTGRVERYVLGSGKARTATLFRGFDEDDHANPSLVRFNGTLYAFWAPHSGYYWPRDRTFFVHFRALIPAAAGGLRLGPVRSIPGLGKGCGLGYTYPTPIVSAGRLYVFMRGPCWEPYFTETRSLDRWTHPRTLVAAPSGHKVRPYAKYAAGPDNGIAMAFSDGNPASFATGLYFMTMRGGGFYRADGRQIGTLTDLPFKVGQLDQVAPYSALNGRAWPQDVAVGADGRPVIAYTAYIGDGDRFRYARWNGTAWNVGDIGEAGPGVGGYHNGGITLDHADPRKVIYAATFDAAEEIVTAGTADGGLHWTRAPVTAGSAQPNIRPAFPRGSDGHIAVWFTGRYDAFHDYATRLRMLVPAP